MITKQLYTYTEKVERMKAIISIRRDRIKKNKEALELINQILNEQTSNNLEVQLKKKELEIKALDLNESILENEIQLRIQTEILSEDLAAKDKYEKMKAQLCDEIELNWFNYIENIKENIANIKRKNKNADTSRLSNAVAKANEEFITLDEKIDHFKLLKDLQIIKS